MAEKKTAKKTAKKASTTKTSTKAKTEKSKSSKTTKAKSNRKKAKEEPISDMSIVIVDDDISIDQEKINDSKIFRKAKSNKFGIVVYETDCLPSSLDRKNLMPAFRQLAS